MIVFATEFPLYPSVDRGVFLAQVLAWLRGVKQSTVLDTQKGIDLDQDTGTLRSDHGEELRIREFARGEEIGAIGFRHDIPDADGRLWRTEAGLRLSQGIIRLRTQCIAMKSGARLDTPRKPYLIKSLLQDGLACLDGELQTQDVPHWLSDDKNSLASACHVVLGGASKYLPVIYITAIGHLKWAFSKEQIEKLAYDLGGVAHVVVEPTKDFSFRLRGEVADRNPYGGTVALCLPGQGIVREFYLGYRLANTESLFGAVSFSCVSLRSQMPAEGWDWTELQEQALRRQRERDKQRLTAEESIEIYEEEIEYLRERIKQQEEQIAARSLNEDNDIDGGFLPAAFVSSIGPEIYPGEFVDRMRFAVRECITRVEQLGWDRRTAKVLEKMGEIMPTSPALGNLLDDLARAVKEPKRVADELSSLLSRHGYRKKSDNKHIRLEAKDGFVGLDTITVPKTPSDRRGLLNLRRQVESALGLVKLKD